MSPENAKKLKMLLSQHEGYMQFPYVDITGHLTIGYGRNLSDRGLSHSEAYFLLNEDIMYFSSKLILYVDFFSDLSEERQIALINMCFNVGVKGLLNFKKMLDALKNKDYELAAQEMLDSKWASQVGDRAKYLANVIKTGKLIF